MHFFVSTFYQVRKKWYSTPMPTKDTPTKKAPKNLVRQASEELAQVADMIEETSETTVESAKRAAEHIATQAKTAAKAADTKVRENPWPAVAGAGLIGALLGFFAGRSRR